MRKFYSAAIKVFACFLICSLLQNNFSRAQKIITVAGNANGNGPGYSKKYNNTPTSYGVAADALGNVFFSEIDKSTVTKVDFEGNVVLVAGNVSEPGFSGDGGLATNAKLAGPRGISIDKSSNIYIADTYNNRVRKIDQNGIITTIAGGGNGGDGGLAVNASLVSPVDVIADSIGNVYISEQGANKIRKINTKGIITTVAGNGVAGFSGDSGKAVNASINQPSGICFNKQGNLIISDTHNHRVRKVNKNGIIVTIAGNGIHGDGCGKNDSLAISVSIGEPTDVDVDTSGNIYLLAGDKCYIQYIDKKGYIYNLASASNTPQSLAYSKTNNKVYYSTIYEDVCWGHVPNVLSVDLGSLKERDLIDGNSNVAVYNGDSIGATVAHLNNPRGLIVANNSVYFIDANFYRVRKIDSKGIITTIAGNGVKGNTGLGDGGLAINASLNNPYEIAIDKKGNIFISDKDDNRIRKINAQGVISTAYTIASPQGLMFDSKGNLYVSSTAISASKVYKITTAGVITTVAGTNGSGYNGDHIPATTATLAYPAGLYIDKYNNLFIADYGNSRIRRVDTLGIITTVAGGNYDFYDFAGDGGLATDAVLHNPTGITGDKAGNFYITDQGNNRIRIVDLNHIINTVVGGGGGITENCDGEWYYYGTYSGDDDSAFGANLNYPYNMAFDNRGNMLLSDEDNDRIREVIYNCSLKPVPSSTAMQQYINKKLLLQTGCNLLATIAPRLNYLTALNTNVITNVWVDNKIVRDSSGKPFAPRHYQIYPERNKYVSSTATFTLYFNQSDFDKYNSSTNSSYAKLPTSPTDSGGIANLSIYTYRSKSQDGSGLPTSYKAAREKLNSTNKKIAWNKTGKYWEVSFNVSSLGGFFVGTEKKNVSVLYNDASQLKAEAINVYPNPATDNINISLPTNLLYKMVQLFNLDGKLINSKIADSQNINFNVTELASGIYIVRFADGEVKKVIISKK
ncbi:MAG: T9SS type A sorting domain-containing protein [Parafilimonas sp.]